MGYANHAGAGDFANENPDQNCSPDSDSVSRKYHPALLDPLSDHLTAQLDADLYFHAYTFTDTRPKSSAHLVPMFWDLPIAAACG